MIQVSIVANRVLDPSLDEDKDTTGEVKGVTSMSQRTWHPGVGSPKAGTPLMVASPLLALDLPLKILVCRNRDGEVLVSYNATSYLARLSRRWSYLPHERWSHSQERIDAGGAREAGVW
jgi:hypothetical protein